MKTHDLQVISSLDISGPLEIPIVSNSDSIPSGLKSGSIFFNKEDKNMYIVSASQVSVVGSQSGPAFNGNVEYLVVAGGGGGGGGTANSWGGGGGGAGGLLSGSIT